jgi:hypothetical protein
MSSYEPSDSELDRVLSQAQWPATSGAPVARLAAQWRRLQAARRRRRFVVGSMAVAASTLVAVGILAWRRTDTQSTAVAPVHQQVDSNDKQPHAPAADPHPLESTASNRWAVAPREPNAYERVVLSHIMLKPKQVGVAAQQELIEELIGTLAADANAEVEDRLTSLPSNLARCEAQLADAARQGPSERRLGAARLLSRIGTRRSVPLLAELAADPATHEAAVLGLARLSSDRNLAQLASFEQEGRLRGKLLRMLLERRTREAVALYLGFVSAAASQSEALRVVADMDNPPAEQLLAFMESPQNSLRLAAALALSRVSDPAVVEQLCASVWGIGRHEVLIALLLSQSKEAAGCVQHARENLYLVASLRAAEQQLGSLHIQRGGNLP